MGSINKIYLICTITNKRTFNGFFPDGIVQPSWEYKPNKNVIKIDLGKDIVNILNQQEIYEYTVEEFLMLDEIDVDPVFFGDFGKISIYVEYTFEQKRYINFYHYYDTIMDTHFLYKNSKTFDAFYTTIEYHTEKGYHSMDITEFTNLFTNNDNPITFEAIMLFHDLDVQIEQCIYKMHYNYGTVYYLPKKEIINLKK